MNICINHFFPYGFLCIFFLSFSLPRPISHISFSGSLSLFVLHPFTYGFTLQNPTPSIQIDLIGPRSPTPEEESFPWVEEARRDQIIREESEEDDKADEDRKEEDNVIISNEPDRSTKQDELESRPDSIEPVSNDPPETKIDVSFKATFSPKQYKIHQSAKLKNLHYLNTKSFFPSTRSVLPFFICLFY